MTKENNIFQRNKFPVENMIKMRYYSKIFTGDTVGVKQIANWERIDFDGLLIKMHPQFTRNTFFYRNHFKSYYSYIHSYFKKKYIAAAIYSNREIIKYILNG